MENNKMIRKMTRADKPSVMEMMRVFYASPAVSTNGSDEIFSRDIDECTSESHYLEGYVFERDGELQGYAMVAKSFSTEFGKPCAWIEDIYVVPKFRGGGLGGAFLEFIQGEHPECIFRLEVEAENEGAVRLYEKSGFGVLPYMEMKK